ncbi:MAG: asparagine synthase-related protein [Methanomassiliicoccus sp.]|nr:asparagine synthase-related protein [Methanomassiliicoccus sp.]
MLGGAVFSMSDELAMALDGAVEGIMTKGPVAIMFSGGLDSGFLAALAKRHGTPHLYTVGMKGSHDMVMSEESARYLDLLWTPFVTTTEEVIAACRELLITTGVKNPITLSFELPLQMIASRAEEEILISGQGADELFGGYSRYQEMSMEAAHRTMADDLTKMLSDVIPLEESLARRYGKKVERPFLDPAVRKIAASMSVEEKFAGGERKAPLRRAARSIDAELIASREKKAAQYGSGFMKVLKAQARKERLTVEEYLATLAPGQPN